MSFFQNFLGNVSQALKQNNIELSPAGISKALSSLDMQQAQGLVMQALNTLGGGEAVQSIDQARDKILQGFMDAAADGDISPMEMAEIRGMQKALGISEAQFTEMKLKVLNQLAQKITGDNQVSDNEMQLILELEKDLQFAGSDQSAVQETIAKVKNLYRKS